MPSTVAMSSGVSIGLDRYSPCRRQDNDRGPPSSRARSAPQSARACPWPLRADESSVSPPTRPFPASAGPSRRRRTAWRPARLARRTLACRLRPAQSCVLASRGSSSPAGGSRPGPRPPGSAADGARVPRESASPPFLALRRNGKQRRECIEQIRVLDRFGQISADA